MISILSITAICVSLIVSIGAPVFLLAYFRIHYHITFKSVLFAALAYLIMSLILESTVNYIVLQAIPSTSVFLRKNPFFYAAYGGLIAGTFEETARFLVFAFILKGLYRWQDGIAYGIGHGGFESVVVGGLTQFNYLIYAIAINSGIDFSKTGSASNVMIKIKSTMLSTNYYLYAAAGAERLMVLSLQIALSVLVLNCVKRKKYIYLLFAILIHAAVDFPVGLAQKNVISNPLIIEAILVPVTILSILYIHKSKKI
jgi:uncharacterized membrane protein YhfC